MRCSCDRMCNLTCLALPVARARLRVCVAGWCVMGVVTVMSSLPQGSCGFVVLSVKRLLPVLCHCWGLGKGCIWVPTTAHLPQGLPTPAEAQLGGAGSPGLWGEGEEAESQNRQGLSWPCQPGGAGFLGRTAKSRGGGEGLAGLLRFTSLAEGGSAGGPVVCDFQDTLVTTSASVHP